jgi:hypothetical protein
MNENLLKEIDDWYGGFGKHLVAVNSQGELTHVMLEGRQKKV